MAHHLIVPDTRRTTAVTLCDRRVTAVRGQGDSAALLRPQQLAAARTLARRDLCADCRSTLLLQPESAYHAQRG